jgi:flavin reductase (DIM6/NTAB) family NADH-FMN oxidoreductase RutF
MENENRKDTQQGALRSAFGRFPTGVAIVTALTEDKNPVGMTISSFNSVSLAPALVSWCIDRSAASYMSFTEASEFSISVLSENQAELAMRFATRGANKFHDITPTRREAPLIADACAWFKCETFRRIPLGDHAMLIGRVIDFSASNARPLIFAGGRLRELVPDTELVTRAA